MDAPRVVTIDGAAGSGKSTLARGLGAALGLPYVNTGLMYRALAAAALRAGVATDDAGRLEGLTHGLRFRLSKGAPPELEVEGYSDDELTSLDVERTVSAVSRHPEVRGRMREAQRALGADGAVMEGRDIGSAVFPDAPVKLFLAAAPHARADRRARERPHSSAADLHARDASDATTNPHEPTGDAVVLDTGELGVDATLEAALQAVRDRAPELAP